MDVAHPPDTRAPPVTPDGGAHPFGLHEAPDRAPPSPTRIRNLRRAPPCNVPDALRWLRTDTGGPMFDALPLLSLLPAVASAWLYLKARRELHALRSAHAREIRARDGRLGLMAREVDRLKIRTARMESAATSRDERSYHRQTLDGIVRLQDEMRGNEWA